VAAGKEESQTVIGHGLLFCKGRLRNCGDDVFYSWRQQLCKARTAAGIDSLPPRDRRQPRSGIPGDTGLGPDLQRLQERILENLFGGFK